MRVSHLFILGLVLGFSMVLFGGCAKNKDKAEPTPTRTACEEAREPLTLPFLGDDVRIASQTTLDSLNSLYRTGSILLFAGVLVSLLFGAKLGLGIAGGGVLGIAVAVLFSEFPRTVLVLPVLGVAFLVGWGILWFRRVWGGYTSAKVIVPLVDEMDTGPRSAGRKLKEKIAESGFGETVRKGIKYIKGLFSGKKSGSE